MDTTMEMQETYGQSPVPNASNASGGAKDKDPAVFNFNGQPGFSMGTTTQMQDMYNQFPVLNAFNTCGSVEGKGAAIFNGYGQPEYSMNITSGLQNMKSRFPVTSTASASGSSSSTAFEDFGVIASPFKASQAFTPQSFGKNTSGEYNSNGNIRNY